jgi:hypothetical protein
MAASKKATVAAEPIIMYTSEIEKKTHYLHDECHWWSRNCLPFLIQF